MQVNKYKILIFDFDDTLIDNLESIRHAFTKMIKVKDEDYNEDDFRRWCELDRQFWKNWQDGLIELPENLKKETGKKSDEFLDWVRAQRVLLYYSNSISLKEAIDLNNIYMSALSENVVAIDGAYDTLKYLSNKGYYLIIATNGPKIATRDKLVKIKCIDFVNEILSADMFGYMKPNKEFFEGIEKILNNYNMDEYLMIGNSLKSDVGFANKCNFDSCWFNRRNKKLDNDYQPTIIINKLNELINIL